MPVWLWRAAYPDDDAAAPPPSWWRRALRGATTADGERLTRLPRRMSPRIRTYIESRASAMTDDATKLEEQREAATTSAAIAPPGGRRASPARAMTEVEIVFSDGAPRSASSEDAGPLDTHESSSDTAGCLFGWSRAGGAGAEEKGELPGSAKAQTAR